MTAVAVVDDINNIHPSRIYIYTLFTVSLHRTSLCALCLIRFTKKKRPYFGSLGTSAVGPRRGRSSRKKVLEYFITELTN